MISACKGGLLLKLKHRFLLWWRDIQPFLKRAKEVLTDRRGEGTIEDCIEILNLFSQVLIGNQVFLVERHFTGSRDLREGFSLLWKTRPNAREHRRKARS